MTSFEVAGSTSVSIKYLAAVPGVFSQPPLNTHVIAMHLGGPKRVRRLQGKRHSVQDVPLGSMTLMHAYQANSWQQKDRLNSRISHFPSAW